MKWLTLFLLLFSSALASAQDLTTPPSPRVIWSLGFANQLQYVGPNFIQGFAPMIDLLPMETDYRFELGGIFSYVRGGNETVAYVLVKRTVHIFKSLDTAVGLGPEVIKTADDVFQSTSFGGMLAVTIIYSFGTHWGILFEPNEQIFDRNGLQGATGLTIGLIYSH